MIPPTPPGPDPPTPSYDLEGVTLSMLASPSYSDFNTPLEKGGLYSKISVNGVDYSISDTTKSRFFIVGGNADGSESGRVYLYRYSSSNYYLNVNSSGSGVTNYLYKWTLTNWINNTVISTVGTSPATLTPSDFGLSSAQEISDLGFDGSILFESVKVLT